MIPDLGVIIAAGGSSQRYGEKDKLTEMLGSFPVLLHSVKNFSPLVAPGNLIVAARSEALDEYAALAAEYLPDIAVHFVAGGRNRTGSVRNALAALPLSCGIVAVHDAVRPLVTEAFVKTMFEKAETAPALIPVIPCVDTMKVLEMKKINGEDTLVTKEGQTVDRSVLYAAQTPQIFHSEMLKEAYAQAFDTAFTDDASVVLKYGKNLSYLIGERFNIKLTTQDDLVLAKAILSLSFSSSR